MFAMVATPGIPKMKSDAVWNVLAKDFSIGETAHHRLLLAYYLLLLATHSGCGCMRGMSENCYSITTPEVLFHTG